MAEDRPPEANFHRDVAPHLSDVPLGDFDLHEELDRRSPEALAVAHSQVPVIKCQGIDSQSGGYTLEREDLTEVHYGDGSVEFIEH